jgi:hypothetical protein
MIKNEVDNGYFQIRDLCREFEECWKFNPLATPDVVLIKDQEKKNRVVEEKMMKKREKLNRLRIAMYNQFLCWIISQDPIKAVGVPLTKGMVQQLLRPIEYNYFAQKEKRPLLPVVWNQPTVLFKKWEELIDQN